STRSRRRPRVPGRRRPHSPPARSRRGGSQAARPHGSAPRPSPRNAESAAFRAERPSARPCATTPSSPPPLPRPECTVRAVRLADQWTTVETGLDPRWHDARLDLVVTDEVQRQRALALLGPASPGRVGTTIRFTTSRSGVGVGPEAARRLLRRIDEEGISGTLTLV